jgi:hypothetical protein
MDNPLLKGKSSQRLDFLISEYFLREAFWVSTLSELMRLRSQEAEK